MDDFSGSASAAQSGDLDTFAGQHERILKPVVAIAISASHEAGIVIASRYSPQYSAKHFGDSTSNHMRRAKTRLRAMVYNGRSPALPSGAESVSGGVAS